MGACVRSPTAFSRENNVYYMSGFVCAYLSMHLCIYVCIGMVQRRHMHAYIDTHIYLCINTYHTSIQSSQAPLISCTETLCACLYAYKHTYRMNAWVHTYKAIPSPHDAPKDTDVTCIHAYIYFKAWTYKAILLPHAELHGMYKDATCMHTYIHIHTYPQLRPYHTTFDLYKDSICMYSDIHTHIYNRLMLHHGALYRG
jgi:hypothetical protein